MCLFGWTFERHDRVSLFEGKERGVLRDYGDFDAHFSSKIMLSGRTY